MSHKTGSKTLTSGRLLVKSAVSGMNVALLTIMMQSLFRGGWIALPGFTLLFGLLILFAPQCLRLKWLVVGTGVGCCLVAIIPALREVEVFRISLDLPVLFLMVISGGVLSVLAISFSWLIYRYITEYIFPSA
jgi:hypothetical protein